jgi:hypothetical protein
MWWISVLSIVVGAVFLGFVLTRTTKGERRRSANWHDLHTRGRLFTSQLAHLREVETRRGAPGTPRVPRGKSAKRAGFLWRRHAPVPGVAGGSRPDRLPPE